MKAVRQRKGNEGGVQGCESNIQDYQQRISLVEAALEYKGESNRMMS